MIWVSSVYERCSAPLAIWFFFWSPRFHAAYGMTWRKRIALGRRIYRNWRRVKTGTSYKSHLAMAVKLLEVPPGVKGVVVECGSWLGGTTTNLSVICDVVGRDLI